MAKTPRVIAVQWNRFGPYHRARLNNLSSYASERGIRVVAIETTETDALYDWKTDTGKSGFEHEILFPGKDYGELKPSEIARAMSDCLSRLDVDGVAIQSYSFPGARSALKWCRQNRKTAVLMNVSRKQDAARVAWREKVKETLLSQFDAALLSGSQAADYAMDLGFPEEQIFSGCTVIDNEHFSPKEEAHDLTKRSGGFLVSSRFMPRKNLPILIKAYKAYVDQSESPWPMQIMGDGDGRADLERQIKETGLEKQVDLLGFCDYESLPQHYGNAKVFVHPASNDQWALVVNEAMASGLPVLVSTGAGSHIELVDEGKNGFAFDPNDQEQLTSLMLFMSQEANLNSMGLVSQGMISEWNLDRFSRKLVMAFEKGSTRSDRGLDAKAALVFKTLEVTARDSFAFHTVDS